MKEGKRRPEERPVAAVEEGPMVIEEVEAANSYSMDDVDAYFESF